MAFQTSNPIYDSHKYLVKTVSELFDGVLIHSLFGNLKPGDAPANIFLKAIDSLIYNCFMPDSVAYSKYPLDMRYAKPKEALLYAIFRQTMFVAIRARGFSILNLTLINKLNKMLKNIYKNTKRSIRIFSAAILSPLG